MPSKTQPLSSVAKVQGGYAFKSQDFTTAGVPLLKISNVRHRIVDTSDLVYVPKSIADQATRYFINDGDILISMTGSGPNAPASLVGRVARYSGPDHHFLINQRVGRFLVDESKADRRYIYYCLSTPVVQDALVAISTGSANQANISGSQIEGIEIPIPSIAEQKAIAHILGTLDDKIELNRKMNETLESMARALFKSWFIDFDPVRAKMDGRWKRGLSLPGLPADLWELFPGRLTKGEHGDVPEGWTFRTLAESSDVVMGQSPPGESYNESGEGIVFYQGRAEFGFRYPSPRLYCTDPTRFAERGAVLLSVRAPVGDLNVADQKIAIGRGLAAIKHREGGQSFTYYLLKSASDFFQVFDGEGTVFGSINKDALLGMKHIEPAQAVLEKYLQIVEPVDKRIEAAENDSKILSKTRDVLLPRLISGDLKLTDTGRFFKEQ